VVCAGPITQAKWEQDKGEKKERFKVTWEVICALAEGIKIMRIRPEQERHERPITDKAVLRSNSSPPRPTFLFGRHRHFLVHRRQFLRPIADLRARTVFRGPLSGKRGGLDAAQRFGRQIQSHRKGRWYSSASWVNHQLYRCRFVFRGLLSGKRGGPEAAQGCGRQIHRHRKGRWYSGPSWVFRQLCRCFSSDDSTK